MCFSPEADVVAAVVVGAVGIDAVRHVRNRREVLLASLPLLFAVHQLIEAFVWWGLRGSVGWDVGRAALWWYLVIAFVLPVVVPVAVRMVEPAPRRRELMTGCIGLGGAVSALLLVEVLRGPIAGHAHGWHVAYAIGHGAGSEIVVLYALATCGALVASSIRPIAIFGVLNAVAVVLLAVSASNGLPSLWCFWAAVTSVMIAVYLRRRDPLGDPSPTPSAASGDVVHGHGGTR
jgi:hypothetical protein